MNIKNQQNLNELVKVLHQVKVDVSKLKTQLAQAKKEQEIVDFFKVNE